MSQVPAAELRPQKTKAKRETIGRNRALLAGAACTWARSSAVTNTERSKPGSRCMCNCVLRRRNLAHGSGRSVSKKQNINALYATVYLMCARAHCVTACGSTRCAREQTEVSDRRLFAKPGEKSPGRVTLQGRESPNWLHDHAVFELLPIAITTTGIPASFEQTQRVPTGHPDVCPCVVSGATKDHLHAHSPWF